MTHHSHEGHCSCSFVTPAAQSLEEMDFERGIWSAARDGELKRVQQHLDKGVDPNKVDSSGYTALHYASRNGHLQVCNVLLLHGANANCQTPSGHVTPLHRASYCGHIDIVKLLIKYNGKSSLCDSDGKSALHKNYVYKMEPAKLSGANTPEAVEKEDLGIIKLLIAADPTLLKLRDNKNKVALDYAPHLEALLQE